MHTSGSWSESLSVLISRIEPLRKLDAGPTCTSHFWSPRPCLTPPLPCTPSRNYFRTSSFYHEIAPSMTLNFSQLMLPETDPIRHRAPLDPTSLREALIHFFVRELTPFILEEVKLTRLTLSCVHFSWPRLFERATQLLRACQFISTAPLATLDQLLRGRHPISIALRHSRPSGLKPLSSKAPLQKYLRRIVSNLYPWQDAWTLFYF